MLQKNKDKLCPSNRPRDKQQFVRTVQNVIRKDVLINFYSNLNCSFVREILVVTFVILVVFSRVR